LNSLYGIEFTSTNKSNLSNNGPDILFIYRSISYVLHLHSFSDIWYPHGQGFIAPTNKKLHGYSKLYFILDIFIILSSIGCLNVSNIFLSNSAISSRNNIPL